MLDTTSSGPLKAPIDLQWLPLKSLYWDKRVNTRDPDARLSHLNAINAVFSWHKVKIPTVSKRKDGYAVLDSMGTVTILRDIRGDDPEMLVPCRVVDFSALPEKKRLQREAEIFDSQLDTKRLRSTDHFLSGVTRQIPENVEIEDVLAEIKMTFKGKWPDAFSNMPVVLLLQRTDPNLLKRTLLVARAIWNSQPAVDPTVMAALGALLKAYPRLSEKRLRHVLTFVDPDGLKLGFQSTDGKFHIYGGCEHVALKIRTLYNKGIGADAKLELGPLTDFLPDYISTWKQTSTMTKKLSHDNTVLRDEEVLETA
jgi:hypothetical protein